MVGYGLVVSLFLFLLARYRNRIASVASSVTDRQVWALIGLTFLALLIAFAVVYPIANAGVVGGGSDADDALNLAVSELLQGRYPYYPETYLGNPISPLPGALFLSIPFVLLGNGAYQNFFWLLVFVLAMKSYLNNGRLALLLLWLILALSPAVPYQMMIGSDYTANTLYILLFMLWLLRAASEPDLPGWQKTLPAIFLGIGLSSRANFLLILPLVAAALVRIAGWRGAIRYMGITGVAFAAVTLPFYLYDPAAFSPLHTHRDLSQFNVILPYAGVVIPLVTGVIAGLLAIFRPANQDFNMLLKQCAIVLAFPVLCGIVLATIWFGRLELAFATFGTFFLYFGAAGYWRDFWGNFSSPTSIAVDGVE